MAAAMIRNKILIAGAAEQYRNSAFAKGAAAFFQKPIDNDELVAAIRTTLGEASPETGLSIHVHPQ